MKLAYSSRLIKMVTYFTNEHLLTKVAKAVDVFERVHPDATWLFLFNNAPSHRKMADDALNADKMNVGRGDKQPKMRDMIWGVRFKRWLMKMALLRG